VLGVPDPRVAVPVGRGHPLPGAAVPPPWGFA
jgi:hypothetical protein